MRLILFTTFGLISCVFDSEQESDNAPSAGAEERWEGQYPGECSDEADNDVDGLFDCDDSDCEGAPNCEEESPDLDLDGTTDADADDPGDGEEEPPDTDTDTDIDTPIDDNEGDEAGECSDGIDNDGDVLVDCRDPGCGTSPECLESDEEEESTPETDGTDDEIPSDEEDEGDEEGDPSASACEEEDTGAELGENEMRISGTIMLSGDVDPFSASCRVISWPYAALDEITGKPDLSSGLGMLGEACIDCPALLDAPLPFSVVLPVAEDGEQVGIVAKVEIGSGEGGRIYEEGCDENPLESAGAGEAEGFSFRINVVEPGVGDPGGGTPLDAGDPLDGEPPEEPPDRDMDGDGDADGGADPDGGGK